MSDEVRVYPLPLIAAEDFAEFAEILANDNDFPSSYASWVGLSHARSVEVEEDGYTPTMIKVSPMGFRRFLKDAGGAWNMNGLTAYVALLAK